MIEEALNGTMTEKDILENGIEVNLPRGLTVKRNVADRVMVDKYVETNPKFEAIDDKVKEQENKIEFLKLVLDSIKYRPQSLGKLLDYNKWSEGFN